MKVKELIEELQKFDQESFVAFTYSEETISIDEDDGHEEDDMETVNAELVDIFENGSEVVFNIMYESD